MKNFLIGLGTAFLILVFMTATFAAGFMTGRTSDLPTWVPVALHPLLQDGSMALTPTTVVEQTGTPLELRELFTPFWQSWDLVHEFYVDQPVDDQMMMQGAIQGMLESLGDEHTSYLDPNMFETANAQLQGEEYEGIGAWVDTTGEYLTIISPMPGSPAEESGLKSGDKVIAVDGEDMTGIDGEAVRQRVIGPKNSTVVLTILREGLEAPFDVKVIRQAIVVPTVAGEILDENIAYVQLFTFGDTTTADLRDMLRDLLKQKPDGMILDLRGNGGGYLVTAIEVASQFIGEGTLMYEVYGDGREEVYNAENGGLATKIPLVVLINEGSASASEIVAGAIQDLGRGYLVGSKSYGKGSVQNYSELVNNSGAVRVTIARWLTPNRRQISKIGLDPNFPVEITEQDVIDGNDTQLQKAVDVLVDDLTPPPTPTPGPALTVTPAP